MLSRIERAKRTGSCATNDTYEKTGRVRYCKLPPPSPCIYLSIYIYKMFIYTHIYTARIERAKRILTPLKRSTQEQAECGTVSSPPPSLHVSSYLYTYIECSYIYTYIFCPYRARKEIVFSRQQRYLRTRNDLKGFVG